MNKLVKRYANLVLIVFFLMIPVMSRAKVIWFLFSIKQQTMRFFSVLGGRNGRA